MEDEAPSIKSYVNTITGQIQNSESCLCIHALSWSYILFMIKPPIILLVCFALKKHNPHTGETNYQHPLHSTPFKNKSPVMITSFHSFSSVFSSVFVKVPVAEPYFPFAFVENQPSSFNFKTSNHLTLRKKADLLIETVATWGSFVTQLSSL